jgi:hypothetical protein
MKYKTTNIYDIKGNNVNINYTEFIRLFSQLGVYRYCPDKKNYIFVKIQDRIFQEISVPDLKKIILDHLNEDFIPEAVMEKVLRSINSLFSKALLDTVPQIEPKLIRDTKDRSFIYYSNGILSVRNDRISMIDYKSFPGHIWIDQILDRDFFYDQIDLSGTKSEFEVFVDKVCGSIKTKKESLESIIGYLLHTYKDPAFPKVVVLTDELDLSKQGDLLMGRTGKGIIARSLGYFRKITQEDGKLFSPNANFLFQQVDLDTEIWFLDDAKQGFPFEKLFSVASEGIQIERKHKDKFSIPFSRSPKLLITSNYPISGFGESHRGRRIEFALTRHYNSTRKPIEEFGHLLFDDWKKDEWARFDLYMIKCLMKFLDKGLIEYNSAYHDEMRLLQETPEGFVQFCKEHLHKGQEYDAKIIFEQYTELYKPEKSNTKNMFSRHLKLWASIVGLEYWERYSNGIKYISFK